MFIDRVTGTIALLGLVGALTGGCGNTNSSDGTSGVTPAPAASGEWYVMIHGERAGPFTEDALEQQAAIGCFGGNTQVWREGQGGWMGLSSALPGLAVGGSDADGEAWSRLLDSAAKVEEPMPAHAGALTSQERSIWLQRNQGTLAKLRKLNGRFGPETTTSNSNRFLGSRTLVRLLSMDAKDAGAKGDTDRALEDIELMGSVAHQQRLLTMAPGPNQSNATEVFEISQLVSMASMAMMIKLLDSNEMKSVAPRMRSRASKSLAWVDPQMLEFIRGQCSRGAVADKNCEDIFALIQASGSS